MNREDWCHQDTYIIWETEMNGIEKFTKKKRKRRGVKKLT